MAELPEHFGVDPDYSKGLSGADSDKKFEQERMRLGK
jgi:hypothetical protein